jgi:hypothetical protein
VVYLVMVLLVTVAINIVTWTKPEQRSHPALALFSLLLAPLWMYMIQGLFQRLHGDANARLVPRLFVRILRFVLGAQALVNGALGILALVRFSTSGPTALYLAPVVVLVGVLFLWRSIHPK